MRILARVPGRPICVLFLDDTHFSVGLMETKMKTDSIWGGGRGGFLKHEPQHGWFLWFSERKTQTRTISGALKNKSQASRRVFLPTSGESNQNKARRSVFRFRFDHVLWWCLFHSFPGLLVIVWDVGGISVP